MPGQRLPSPWAAFVLALGAASLASGQPSGDVTTLAACPENSTLHPETTPPSCTCNPGFLGDITWTDNGWNGSCVDIGCGNLAINRYTRDANGTVKCYSNPAEEIHRIMNGISTFEVGSATPSQLLAVGRNAFPLVVDSGNRILAGAAFVGSGRMATIGHEGLLQSTAPGPKQFLLNIVSWASEGSKNKTRRIAFESSMGTTVSILTAAGYTTVTRSGASDLTGVDVFITTNYISYSDAQLAKIHDFVRRGGGLISGGHAWYWGYSNGDKVVMDAFPGNKLLAPSGLVVLTSTLPGGTYDVVAAPATDYVQSSWALDAMLRDMNGEVALTAAQRSAADTALQAMIGSVPVNHTLFAELRVFSDKMGPIVPTGKQPVVQSTQPARALAARIQIRIALDSTPETTVAHPAGNDFPGAVPATTPRVTKTVTVDGNDYGHCMDYNGMSGAAWRSTGLYAAPGDIITFTVDAAYVSKGLAVQIGCHTDTLYHQDSWNRLPELVRRRSLNTATLTMASGFGGPIYVIVPAGKSLGAVPVTIANAVEMGWHKSGRDGDAEFAAMKLLKAPVFELESDGFIGTYPTSEFLKKTSLQATHAYWNKGMEMYAVMGGYQVGSCRGQRHVADRQIGGGYMHSGYPWMSFLDAPPAILNGAAGWGAFHEMGHNHAWKDSMLPNTGEIVCNIYSLYLSYKLSNYTAAQAHPNFNPSYRAMRLAAWQRNPGAQPWQDGMNLDLYIQLQEKFGWSLFETVLPLQRNRPLAQRPADNDNARYQQWIIDTSNVAGANLVPFYRDFGFPIDNSTVAAVQGLPAWLDYPLAIVKCNDTMGFTCGKGQALSKDQMCNYNTNCTAQVCCYTLPVACNESTEFTCQVTSAPDPLKQCTPGKDCTAAACCAPKQMRCGSLDLVCPAGQVVATTDICTGNLNCTVDYCCRPPVRVRSVAVVSTTSSTFGYNMVKATVTLENGSGALIYTTSGTVTGNFNSTENFKETNKSVTASKTTSQAIFTSTFTFRSSVAPPQNTMFCVTSINYPGYIHVPGPKDCSPVMFPTTCGNREGKSFPYCDFPYGNKGMVQCGLTNDAPCTFDYCCNFICELPGTDGFPCDLSNTAKCAQGHCVFVEI